MREPIRDIGRLKHILTTIDILQDGAKRYTIEQAEKDSIVFYGFVKQVEIIGEATYMLPRSLEIPIQKQNGMLLRV